MTLSAIHRLATNGHPLQNFKTDATTTEPSFFNSPPAISSINTTHNTPIHNKFSSPNLKKVSLVSEALVQDEKTENEIVKRLAITESNINNELEDNQIKKSRKKMLPIATITVALLKERQRTLNFNPNFEKFNQSKTPFSPNNHFISSSVMRASSRRRSNTTKQLAPPKNQKRLLALQSSFLRNQNSERQRKNNKNLLGTKSLRSTKSRREPQKLLQETDITGRKTSISPSRGSFSQKINISYNQRAFDPPLRIAISKSDSPNTQENRKNAPSPKRLSNHSITNHTKVARKKSEFDLSSISTELEVTKTRIIKPPVPQRIFLKNNSSSRTPTQNITDVLDRNKHISLIANTNRTNFSRNRPLSSKTIDRGTSSFNIKNYRNNTSLLPGAYVIKPAFTENQNKKEDTFAHTLSKNEQISTRDFIKNKQVSTQRPNIDKSLSTERINIKRHPSIENLNNNRKNFTENLHRNLQPNLSKNSNRNRNRVNSNLEEINQLYSQASEENKQTVPSNNRERLNERQQRLRKIPTKTSQNNNTTIENLDPETKQYSTEKLNKNSQNSYVNRKHTNISNKNSYSPTKATHESKLTSIESRIHNRHRPIERLSQTRQSSKKNFRNRQLSTERSSQSRFSFTQRPQRYPHFENIDRIRQSLLTNRSKNLQTPSEAQSKQTTSYSNSNNRNLKHFSKGDITNTTPQTPITTTSSYISTKSFLLTTKSPKESSNLIDFPEQNDHKLEIKNKNNSTNSTTSKVRTNYRKEKIEPTTENVSTKNSSEFLLPRRPIRPMFPSTTESVIQNSRQAAKNSTNVSKTISFTSEQKFSNHPPATITFAQLRSSSLKQLSPLLNISLDKNKKQLNFLNNNTFSNKPLEPIFTPRPNVSSSLESTLNKPTIPKFAERKDLNETSSNSSQETGLDRYVPEPKNS